MQDTDVLPFPPAKLLFMGEDQAASIRNGDYLLNAAAPFVNWRDGRVLDIGCGYGRLAYALHRNGFKGQYVGIDILKPHVSWLQQNFTPHAPQFVFRHSDIHNARYNPEGTLTAAEFRAPALDAPPTIITALSVFTHMYEADIRAYLREMSRVSDENTTIYCTFFVCDAEQRRLNPRGISMNHVLDDGCFYHSEADPLHAIGYKPERIADMISSAGLMIDNRVMGSWCGRPGARSYQDSYFLTI